MYFHILDSIKLNIIFSPLKGVLILKFYINLMSNESFISKHQKGSEVQINRCFKAAFNYFYSK